VLLAHSLDDQAETVLLGLARGSGARSLAGMAAATGVYRRPLLGVTRQTLRRACADQGLTPWDDPHNSDPSFTRVRVRIELLPALERALGPGVPQALARSADLLRADNAALDGWAETAYGEIARVEPGSLGVADLEVLPAAVRMRVLRRALLDAGCPPGALSSVHLHAVEELVVGWHGQAGADLPGGVRAHRAYDRLWTKPAEGASE
jgi:tRNA(Ile)-lysidine synthase